MNADDGKSKHSNSSASDGLGYWDAQCPHDLKFANDKADAYQLLQLKRKELAYTVDDSKLGGRVNGANDGKHKYSQRMCVSRSGSI